MAAPEVRVERGALWVGRRAIPLTQVRLAAAEQRSPSLLLPAVVALIAGVVGLPASVFSLAGGGAGPLEGVAHGVLLVAVGAFFGSVWRILSAEDRYCVVLETPSGPRTALACADPQLVVSLVAQVNDLLGRPR